MVLTCGLAGAGKSTYARGLEDKGFVRLSIDTEAWRCGHTKHPLPVEVSARIAARQREELVAALSVGQAVVVDYSFHARSTRDEFRAIARACGASVEVVCVDVPPELLDAYIDGFEWPQSDEVDIVVR